MKTKKRIYVKIAAILVLSILFVWLIQKDRSDFSLKQPQGMGIKVGDSWILIEALIEAGVNAYDEIKYVELKEKYRNEEMREEYLTYEDYIQMLSLVFEEEKNDELEIMKQELEYKEKYKSQFYLLKDDWYAAYRSILSFYELNGIIYEDTVGILTDNSRMTGMEKTGDGFLIDDKGKVYETATHDFKEYSFAVLKVFMTEHKLLTIVEETDQSIVLENMWLMEASEEFLLFYFMGFEIKYELKESEKEAVVVIREGKETFPDPLTEIREQIGDFRFSKGRLTKLKAKTDRINGKIVRVGEGEVELENLGTYKLDEACKVYRLYEELTEANLDSLALGYDFTDFVLENGRICSALIMRKEEMESIRIAVKGNGFAGLYHDELRFCSDLDMEIKYGSYEDRRTEILQAGEELLVSKDSKYVKGDRMEMIPTAQSGKIKVTSLGRNQGAPSYRGTLEVALSEKGLVLINEVLLEEYLYSVVPSEMPASYPEEALKSQAICARTFAYRYLKEPGLAGIGANVDDSVSYQVYNNIAENVNSTKAVKETTGIMMLFQGNPINTYYYSTSCGFGTDAGVWSDGSEKEMPYLQPQKIGGQLDAAGDLVVLAEELKTEEIFEKFIMSASESDYERNEAWYRWQYEVPGLDIGAMEERLRERYEAGPAKILTYTGSDEDYQNPENFKIKKPTSFDKIYEIYCTKRRAGGVMDELIIQTNQGTYKVISEYNIRYLLNNGGEVVRQDESKVKNGQLLPSAYLVINTVRMDQCVVGYTIFGGGYGHGVGMSQNAAKAMGEMQLSCEEILSTFYKECELQKLY